MDARLQHLTDLIQQAIEEAVKTVREQEREEHRLQECVNLIKKLRGEISSEQRELNAERKKAAALSARSKKLDRDMLVWQQKLDYFVSQSKEMKSHYVGKMGADVMDSSVDADESLVIASLPVVDPAVDINHLLPFHVQEHDCDMWTSDSIHKGDHRDPKMLPPMQLVESGTGYMASPKVKKGGRGRKRKTATSESDSEDLPKKRVVRKRIVDADGSLAKLSSEFKRECLALLNPGEAPAWSNGEADVGNGAEAVRDWQSSEEIAVITAPRPGQPLDLRCASHKFCPQSIVTVPRRFNQKDFESKMKLIQSCANLRIFCMFGMEQRMEQMAATSLAESLAHSCPKIEHFILDDGLLDIAIAYQEILPNNIRVVEIKNEQGSEDEVIHLIETSSEIRSVYLKHSSVKMIERIVPRVKSLSLCWITDHEFQSLIRCGKQSEICELMLETVDLTMDAVRIGQLASALPHLQLLKLSAPMEHIHCLQMFKNLRHVVFDSECHSKIDPNFPIDMSLALEMSRKQDGGNEPVVKEEEEEEGISQQSLSCQIGLNKFFASCGHTLSSFSITIRERFKKDFFHDLKRGCPVLQELTILSITEQFFDPKSLSLPSLTSLSLQFISISDTKLIEVLDSCRNLDYISIDKPRKITSSCINVLYFYGEEIFSKRQLTSNYQKFTAVILTEGREELSKHIHTDRIDITFKQKAVAEISNRLRYKY